MKKNIGTAIKKVRFDVAMVGDLVDALESSRKGSLRLSGVASRIEGIGQLARLIAFAGDGVDYEAPPTVNFEDLQRERLEAVLAGSVKQVEHLLVGLTEAKKKQA